MVVLFERFLLFEHLKFLFNEIPRSGARGRAIYFTTYYRKTKKFISLSSPKGTLPILLIIRGCPRQSSFLSTQGDCPYFLFSEDIQQADSIQA
jgi:hypothetical protein